MSKKRQTLQSGNALLKRNENDEARHKKIRKIKEKSY